MLPADRDQKRCGLGLVYLKAVFQNTRAIFREVDKGGSSDHALRANRHAKVLRWLSHLRGIEADETSLFMHGF